MNDLDPTKPKTRLIGIDQSYSGFGLVVLDENGQCLQKNLSKYPLNKFNNEGERLVKIYTDLQRLLILHKSFGSVLIGMEGYAYGAKLNREKLGELGGIVKLCIHNVCGVYPVIVQPTSLKQHFTGSGKATKDEMVKAVQKFDPSITDNNLADAFGIAHLLYSSQ